VAVALLLGLSGVEAGGCLDLTVAGTPCTTSAQCEDQNPCTDDSCTDKKVCQHVGKQEDFVLPIEQQTAGDCKTRVCRSGEPAELNDDQDKLDDGDSCTVNGCNAGTPTTMGQPDGMACTLSGANGRCAMGKCMVECSPSKPCDDKNPCTEDACDGATNTCSFSPLDGVATPGFTPKAGDCRQQICIMGKDTPVVDDSDIPDDANPCTLDTCTNGIPSNANVPSGELCTAGQPDVCDGSGKCVECTVPADCVNLPPDDECQTRTCVASKCGQTFAAMGTPASVQTAGDCKKVVCDGAGTKVSTVDDTDVPNDNNPCTSDTCTSGTPSNSNLAANTSCGASLYCDGKGSCVGCTMASQCAGTDDFCKTRTCVNGQCGVSFAAAGTPLPSGQTAKDCKVIACDGAGNVATIPDNSDVPIDGNQCTKDVCSMGTPSNPPEAPGFSCNQNGGTVCNGAGACKRQLGQVCSLGSDCASGNCVDGVCCGAATCGTCQTCNGGAPGTCTNVPNGQSDDTCMAPGYCNGSGSCSLKKANGQACSAASDCQSGNCIDGYCCDSSCGATCYSCGVPGSEGTCMPVPQEGTDSSPACTGTHACDGAGACKLAGGQPCSTNADCAGGACVGSPTKKCAF
jgi:hypothetical protein